MAAAKWQQASGGAKKCENGGPEKARNSQPKKCENERKSAKNGRENKRKREKTIGVLFVVRLSAIFQWPYSSGHLGFSLINNFGGLSWQRVGVKILVYAVFLGEE